MKKILNMVIAVLQIFADSGTLVNATGSYVNAYTGATTPFDSSNSFAGEIKTFFDTTLLMNARAEMYYAQFAVTQPLPKGRGKTVEWRKWNTFARASKLQEGVIPTGQKFGMTVKTGTIDQYGTYTSITWKHTPMMMLFWALPRRWALLLRRPRRFLFGTHC